MPRSLDPRLLFIGVLALGLVSFDHQPGAHHPGVHAEAVDGEVEVDAVYLATDTCWRLASAGAGAPRGIEPPPGAIAVLVSVERRGEVCGQAITPVKANVRVPDVRGARAVMLYVVDADGRIVKTDRGTIRR